MSTRILGFCKSKYKYDNMKRVKRTSSFWKSMSKYGIMKRVKRKTSLNSNVVQEYERAVVFRLGRLQKGGDKGPGHKQSYCSVICACTRYLLCRLALRS